MLNQGTHLIDGPVGSIEILVDVPNSAAPSGVVVIGHPQPLLGGSAKHKVPHFLAKGFAEAGFVAVRPNFRGVGQTAGTHDAGSGETEDLLSLIQAIRNEEPDLPLHLVGFSFGAFVQAKVADVLTKGCTPANSVCLAGMPYGDVEGGRSYNTPKGLTHALVIHGEMDEIVPLSSVFEWARPTNQVVLVVTGGDHFFAGRLHILRSLMLEFIVKKNAIT
jgi:alpha/beta superfamily hydrolase